MLRDSGVFLIYAEQAAKIAEIRDRFPALKQVISFK
jgi:hypothetical protein